MRQRDIDRVFKKSPGAGLIICGIPLWGYGIFSVCSGLDSLGHLGLIFILLGSVLFVIGIIVIVTNRITKREEENILLSSNIEDLDGMSGIEFEDYLEALFKKEGYSVKRTKASGDFGVDLILSKRENTYTKQIIVQAKRYNKKVSVSAVQEISAAMNHYGIYEAWVVTNNYFTNPAVSLAKSNGVTLVDRLELAKHINSVCSTNKESPNEETP